jgi:hypothetical protein
MTLPSLLYLIYLKGHITNAGSTIASYEIKVQAAALLKTSAEHSPAKGIKSARSKGGGGKKALDSQITVTE